MLTIILLPAEKFILYDNETSLIINNRIRIFFFFFHDMTKQSFCRFRAIQGVGRTQTIITSNYRVSRKIYVGDKDAAQVSSVVLRTK